MLYSQISDKIIYMEHRDGFVKHQIISFGNAWEGVIYSFKTQLHFKFHIIALVIVILLGVIYSISIIEWLIIFSISSVIISAEAINTAMEETCNLLHPDIHPKAKLAKHCAAGGVLILSVAAVIIGLIIFLPKIFS